MPSLTRLATCATSAVRKNAFDLIFTKCQLDVTSSRANSEGRRRLCWEKSGKAGKRTSSLSPPLLCRFNCMIYCFDEIACKQFSGWLAPKKTPEENSTLRFKFMNFWKTWFEVKYGDISWLSTIPESCIVSTSLRVVVEILAEIMANWCNISGMMDDTL